MDRNARILSLLAVGLAILLGGYLSRNPRGQPRSRLASIPPDNPPESESVSARLVDPGSLSTAERAERDERSHLGGDTFVDHMARLNATSLELTRDELDGAREANLFEVLKRVRPYWLSDTLGASVRVDGQLLGNVETLRAVPRVAADFVRLEFSTAEPHWVVRVFLKG